MVKLFKYIVFLTLFAGPVLATPHAGAQAKRSPMTRHAGHLKPAAFRASLALPPAAGRPLLQSTEGREDLTQQRSATAIDFPVGTGGLVGSVGVHHLSDTDALHRDEVDGLAAARFAQPASLVGATFSYRF